MEIFRIFIENFDIKIIFSLTLLIIILFGIIVFLFVKYFNKKNSKNKTTNNIQIVESTLGIGNNTITLKPNYEDLQIAYKLWVELSTRKIGIKIDFEHDVINEIYNSWYEFFKITRELIKNIPVSKIRKNQSTRKLVKISIAILNKGLRPHLTKWQARFISWYNINFEKYKDLTPQEIQEKFSNYNELKEEMGEVNKFLIEYKKVLEIIYKN